MASSCWIRSFFCLPMVSNLRSAQQTKMAEQENVSNRGVANSARDFLSRLTRWLCDESAYARTMDLFLRALGVVYFIAFTSLAVQMPGLYGSQGILPIADWMARQTPGAANVRGMPTVFWLNTSDVFAQGVPIVGALLALLLVFGFHSRIFRFLLFALYLSLVVAGQDFLQFQWDYLLLEVGFLAIFLRDSMLVLWLSRWLLFRVMFVSGLVKILSGDSTWRNLTALDYHFETQPLPNIIGFYVHHLPSVVHQVMVAVTFFIELVVPFLIFAPLRLRFIAAVLIALLQLQIFVTGNYNFFNLLVMALCILLLDDRAIQIAATRTRNLPPQVGEKFPVCKGRLGIVVAREFYSQRIRFARWLATIIAVALFVVSGFQFLRILNVPTPEPVAALARAIAPFGIVNQYGPFAIMTTRRPEIIVEGSNDGETWREYEFKFKIGDVRRAPPFVEPHQPRLDWQMWFAALGARTTNPNSLLPELRSNRALTFRLLESGVDIWFVNFAARVLQGSPQVLALLDKNPFPNAPPKFIRARLFEYKFADVDAPMKTGTWWIRADRGIYLPPMSLGQ